MKRRYAIREALSGSVGALSAPIFVNLLSHPGEKFSFYPHISLPLFFGGNKLLQRWSTPIHAIPNTGRESLKVIAFDKFHVNSIV
jgi:hypothetical protein